ncbi:MAG TPA: HEAT repeat domain-containing protein, partial [Candidatus Ozemobacteraceae bacterium]
MDAEFWWRLDLSSPLADVRRMAAMQMLLDPPPASAAAELREIAAREQDAETRDLLCRIVEGFAKSGSPPEISSPAIPPASVDDSSWPGWSDTPARRLEWLGRLPADRRRALAAQAPDRLRSEQHPLVASALIRLFGRAWPEDRLGDLVGHVAGGEGPACLAALETLRQRAPNLLQPLLPGLLVSRNPRIRGAAVGALAGIDLDEALAHLEALLLDPDPARRLEGLRCCLHVPFDKVMPLLLKAMAVETDPRRLAAYGTLFEINPALEAPFRLYELSERVPSDRAEILRRLLAASCRVIGSVLLDPERFQEYRNRLQAWIDRRAAARLAQDIVARAMDGRGLDPDLEAALERARARQPLWTALKELSTLPMPVQARALFLRALGEDVQPATASASTPAAP